MSGLGFGLIGTGFMGRAHAIALHEVAVVFDDIGPARAICVSDSDGERAGRAAALLRFERGTADWRSLLDDTSIDVIDICTPNHLHFEMASAALAARKHVYCEKPLALDVEEAAALAAAASESGVVHGLGLNYTANPVIQVARDLIAAGEIGDVVHFSGRYFEDYMADRDVPFTWRCDRTLAGSGALADLGSHLINLLHFLGGRPKRLLGEVHTAIPERREPATGSLRRVENEDIARAFVELESGVPATLEISRIATGRKCGLTFEIYGTRGSVAFDQERMNELKLYGAGQAAARAGYTTLLAGPSHGDYARFCPAPGHGLGINDLKVIELHNFIRAVEHGERFYPDFEEGLAVQRVMAAIERSSAERAWVDVEHKAV